MRRKNCRKTLPTRSHPSLTHSCPKLSLTYSTRKASKERWDTLSWNTHFGNFSPILAISIQTKSTRASPNGVGITALEIKFDRRSNPNLKQRRDLGGLQESLNWLHEELNGYFKVCYLLALSGALAIIPSATSKKERRKKQISILEKYKVFFSVSM